MALNAVDLKPDWPLKEFLIKAFYEAPQYLGPLGAVTLITEQGRRFSEVGGQLVEVVVAGAADIPGMIVPELEGVYVVGTGGTGAAQTFFTLGVVYFLVMVAASLMFRVPAEGWRPQGWSPDPESQTSVPKAEERLPPA